MRYFAHCEREHGFCNARICLYIFEVETLVLSYKHCGFLDISGVFLVILDIRGIESEPNSYVNGKIGRKFLEKNRGKIFVWGKNRGKLVGGGKIVRQKYFRENFSHLQICTSPKMLVN